MATGGASTRKEEDFRHTCGLCMEPYRGRTPKILPCFHTFCLPCLTALHASVTKATPGNPPEDGNRLPEGEEAQSETNTDDNEKKTQETPDSKGEPDDVNTSGHDARKAVLLCPMCRAPVPVPDGGVADLQVRNAFILDFCFHETCLPRDYWLQTHYTAE
ncbi:hypothetical protein V1264_009427 [Littorina saxatilis]|uniref:RING-type domain-containing protein n=1 Tax=Littorina saxatilis TaxID=31220 RepID=A0AAN9G1D3_9CAEN